MPVHTRATLVEEDRPVVMVADSSIDRPPAGGNGTSAALPPLPNTRSTRCARETPV
jgi:hypothetical protein